MNWEPVLNSAVRHSMDGRRALIGIVTKVIPGERYQVAWVTHQPQPYVTIVGLANLAPYREIEAPQDTGSPTSEAIIQNMYRENADNLRWWKEGYADGFPAGFEAGREYQLEQ